MICDIIIPVWNRLQLTKDCIDSIIKNTNLSYRLIIIDNNSDQETADYLKMLKDKEGLSVIIIRNEQNLGFVKAINQGLKASGSEFACLLNNDTQVQEKWLEELICVAQSSPRIGIVNPGDNSDYFPNKELFGKWVEIGFASGYCMLIKREVIEKIGQFDEAYDIGFWEETDYCQRAKKAGYICVSAKASYVYHHAHRTFEIFKEDEVKDLFENNRKLFISRWGKILQIAYVVFKKTISEKDANLILKLARDGHMVYIFYKSSAEVKADIEHGSVRKYICPDIAFHIYIFGKILIRSWRRKRFNKIFMDNSWFARFLLLFNYSLQIEIL